MKNQPPAAFVSVMFILMAVNFLLWPPLMWWRVLGAMLLLAVGGWGVIAALRARRVAKQAQRES